MSHCAIWEMRSCCKAQPPVCVCVVLTPYTASSIVCWAGSCTKTPASHSVQFMQAVAIVAAWHVMHDQDMCPARQVRHNLPCVETAWCIFATMFRVWSAVVESPSGSVHVEGYGCCCAAQLKPRRHDAMSIKAQYRMFLRSAQTISFKPAAPKQGQISQQCLHASK